MDSSPVYNGIITVRILFIILPLIMGQVHCIWRKNAAGFSKVECFLVYFLTISVGLQSLIVGRLEIYDGKIVAAYTGWANTPFLSELGKANITFGILGVLSFWFRGGWRSAAAVGYGLFIMMSGLGHLGYLIHDSHPNHAIIAPLILTDFVLALCLFVLLFLRRLSKS